MIIYRICVFVLFLLTCDSVTADDKRPRGEKEPRANARVTSFIPAILPLDGGHVVTVTKESITIRTSVRKEIVTYPFHDELAAGKVHEYAKGVTGYRTRDVHVGDEVWLGICSEDGKKFCAEINIRKRPGGRVPEAFADGPKPTYAERRNADNDLADFGIPIPERFNPPPPITMVIPPELDAYMLELNAKFRAQRLKAEKTKKK